MHTLYSMHLVAAHRVQVNIMRDKLDPSTAASPRHSPHGHSLHEQLPRSPRSYIVLSIAASVVVLSLKLGAFLLTNSVGLFSDAAESIINLIAALAAFGALTVAARPADAEHTYGHTKAEYFSSGLESSLILVAAIAIAATALDRLLHLEPIENIGLGLAISVLATLINGTVGLVLIRAAKQQNSITLRADGYHLLTDVWTSAGVLVGVLLVAITGQLILDPIVALLAAANIAWTAIRLLRDSVLGLMDTALPSEDQKIISGILRPYEGRGVRFHAFRSRMSGQRRFLSMHVLLPGGWTIKQGHDMCEQIERDVIHAFPMITVFTHLEPLEDPVSMEDQQLDREVDEEAASRIPE